MELNRNEHDLFLSKWKVIRGIKKGVFTDVFPGSEDRQIVVVERRGFPGYIHISRIEENRVSLNENIKLLSDEGKKKE